MTTLNLTCSCGAFGAVIDHVSPASANRVTCACEGCQAYARRLGRPEILDQHGATERFQVSPASLRIVSGRQHLACLHQTPKGALRWHTTCCSTPIALTLRHANVPFVGVDTLRIADCTPEDWDVVLGPVRARVNSPLRGDEARRQLADRRSLLRMLAHLLPMFLRWWWRGDARRSPFFDPRTRAPITDVRRLYAQSRPLLGAAGCR